MCGQVADISKCSLLFLKENGAHMYHYAKAQSFKI